MINRVSLLLSYLVVTLLSLGVGILPEVGMYFVYQLLNPTVVMEKVLILGLFWFGGGGLCVLFALLGFGMWAILMSATTELYHQRILNQRRRAGR